MSDAYIQIDGVKGQSVDKDHKDWIEIISYCLLYTSRCV